MNRYFIFLTTVLLIGCSKKNDEQKNVETFPQITICGQTWMSKNLEVTTYRNGDQIPQVSDPTQWSNLTTGAWCYYNNDVQLGSIHGKLYNWYAVNDPRGLAPAGWHIPSDIEWTDLSTCLGGESIAGGKMKSTTLWNSPNIGATNSSGFTGLPSGIRNAQGDFVYLGDQTYFWSSTINNSVPNRSRIRNIDTNYEDLLVFSTDWIYGQPVRCIKD